MVIEKTSFVSEATFFIDVAKPSAIDTRYYRLLYIKFVFSEFLFYFLWGKRKTCL